MDQDRLDITHALKRLIASCQEQEIVTSPQEKEASWNKVKQRILKQEGDKADTKFLKKNETFI